MSHTPKMNRLRLLMMAVLLTSVGRTLADNLTVADVTVNAGETKDVAIVLNNPSNLYAAFQFDLVLPEGVSIAKNSKGKLIASLDDERKDDHSLTVTDVGGGTYRFLSFSLTNAEFYGTDGALVNITLEAATDAANVTKTATIKQQVFTKVSGDQSKWADVTFSIEVKSGGNVPPIDPPVDSGDDKLKMEPVNITVGETGLMSIMLNNPTHQYTAFQFDLVLPEGVSIAKNAKGKLLAELNDGRKDDHSLTVMDVGGGIYRFLSFSLTNVEFSGTDGTLVDVTLQANEGTEGVKTATIKSQVFTEVSGTQYKWADLRFQITVSAPAVPVTVTAKSYTRMYGETNPTFEYTSEGAALNGQPEISCEATATSPVGTYPIVVKKGSVTNNNDTYVDGTLTITKAPLTIKAGTYTKKQGEALPEFTLTYEGIKNGETEAVLTKLPVVSCEATEASAPGEYKVTVADAEAQNYDISYVDGKLIVTDADAVTVTANSYSRVYGDANPTFEFTSEGAALSGTPEISCEATESSPVGTYPIVIKKGGVTNYNDKYVNGVLTITKAPLTVSAEKVTREQNSPNPEFVLYYSGWKVGDDESVLTKIPTATTTATEDSPVGEYEIVVSGGEAQNYELIYVNGILIVEVPAGIDTIFADHPVDVYNVQGRKVRSNATTLKGLPKGVYIVNGRKVVVK